MSTDTAKKKPLYLWKKGPDTVCAYSLQDVNRVLFEFYGEDANEGDDLIIGIPRDRKITVQYISENDVSTWANSRIARKESNYWSCSVTAYAFEWAEHEGRGFLCSTEY